MPFLRSDAGIRGKSAVHGHDDAVHETGEFLVREPEQNAVQVRGNAEPAHRGVSEDLLGAGGQTAVGILEQGAVLLREEESGGDGVAPDPHGGEVDRQPRREIGDRGFRAGIMAKELGCNVDQPRNLAKSVTTR